MPEQFTSTVTSPRAGSVGSERSEVVAGLPGSRPAALVRLFWLALVWGLGLVPMLDAVSSPRIFSDQYTQAVAAQAQGATSVVPWGGLVTVAITLAIGAASLVAGLSRSRVPNRGFGLWASAMLLPTGLLLSSVFGTHPHFTIALLAFPLVFTGAYLLPPPNTEWLEMQVRRLLLVYVYGSLAAALIWPNWAVESPYKDSYVSEFTIRLHGLAPHANVLALLIFCYVALDLFRTRRRRWIDVANSTVAIATLLLTQSKTMLAILLLLVALRAMWYAYRQIGAARYLVVALLGTLACAVAMWAAAIDWHRVHAVVNLTRNRSLMTMTGRTVVWFYTVKVWARNPVFGYGPDLWNGSMRLSYMRLMGWAPPHAHNQLFESLGEAGLVGVAGLLIYTVVLLGTSWKSRRASQGVAFTLAVALIIRSLSEPFFRSVITDGNFYVHFIAFALTIAGLRSTAFSKVTSGTEERSRRLVRTGGMSARMIATRVP